MIDSMANSKAKILWRYYMGLFDWCLGEAVCVYEYYKGEIRNLIEKKKTNIGIALGIVNFFFQLDLGIVRLLLIKSHTVPKHVPGFTFQGHGAVLRLSRDPNCPSIQINI